MAGQAERAPTPGGSGAHACFATGAIRRAAPPRWRDPEAPYRPGALTQCQSAKEGVTGGQMTALPTRAPTRALPASDQARRSASTRSVACAEGRSRRRKRRPHPGLRRVTWRCPGETKPGARSLPRLRSGPRRSEPRQNEMPRSRCVARTATRLPKQPRPPYCPSDATNCPAML
jgi:hypothetical protein